MMAEPGMDVSAALTLDIHHQPLARLVVNCPASLESSTIRVGEKSLPFKLLARQGDEQRIAVELPDPLIGVLRVVTVQALAPWTPGQSLRLPRISVEGAVWQEGAANVTLAPTLQLARLSLAGGRQTSAAPAATGETYQVQFFSAQATADLLAQSIEPAVRVESLAHLQLDPTQVSGVLAARLFAQRGETFDLRLVVSREWLIDALETTPPDAIEDRTFLQAADGGQTLQLRLKQAIREGQELRLLVSARRRGATLGEELGPEQFRFLKFEGDVHERRTFAVGSADSGLTIQATGDAGVTRASLADVPPALASAVGRLEGSLLFVDDTAADPLRLALRAHWWRFRIDCPTCLALPTRRLSQRWTRSCWCAKSKRTAAMSTGLHLPTRDVRWCQRDGMAR